MELNSLLRDPHSTVFLRMDVLTELTHGIRLLLSTQLPRLLNFLLRTLLLSTLENQAKNSVLKSALSASNKLNGFDIRSTTALMVNQPTLPSIGWLKF